ncbi:collagen-like triple helix repeat-containing protein, partial [Bacillus sp. 7586-K]
AGPTGPTGPTGATVTSNSMFAANTEGSVISVVVGGTEIPLPNVKNLDDFTANATDTAFTVPATGRYYISYQINTTAGVLVSSRLVINGTTPIPGSIISPVVGISQYNNDVIVDLTAGDTISLELFGLLGVATLLGGGATGAALTIIRVE